MKTLCITAIFCSLIAAPVFSQVSLSTDDLNKIRLIVHDVVKEEITASEARLKDYVNVRFDSVDKRVTQSINITYGLIALIVVAIGIPQIISMLQGRKQKEYEQKFADLYRKIELLEQQRIVSS